MATAFIYIFHWYTRIHIIVQNNEDENETKLRSSEDEEYHGCEEKTFSEMMDLLC